MFLGTLDFRGREFERVQDTHSFEKISLVTILLLHVTLHLAPNFRADVIGFFYPVGYLYGGARREGARREGLQLLPRCDGCGGVAERDGVHDSHTTAVTLFDGDDGGGGDTA